MTLHVPCEISIPACAALLLHAVVLRRFEVDHFTLRLCVTSLAVHIAFAFAFGLTTATTTAASFFGTLTAVILIYRAFLHPLRQFPGPFAARLSKWWTVGQILRSDFRYHKSVVPRLGRKYGDYVRTGPRELLVFDVAAVNAVLGFGSRAGKGPFYDSFERSLHLTRDRTWHRQRRKVWDTGLKQLLADFEPRLRTFAEELVEKIRRVGAEPVPLNEYCMYFAYDVMATLAFGTPMGFNAGVASEEGKRVLAALAPVPWFLNTVAGATQELGPLAQWTAWNRARLVERQVMQNPKPDLMQYLLDVTPRGPAGDLDLLGECRLIIGAGSETSASTLVFILVLLGVHVEYQTALREELDATEAFSARNAHPLLDAVITETLRLWPALLWATQRVAPPEGLRMNNIFIPSGTIVAIPGWSLARDERNFVRPEEWIPERWTSRPELCVNRAASMPFSTGPYSCAGRQLAMLQIRSVVARIVREFEVVLPEGFDERAFFDGVQDRITAAVPKVQIKFVPLDV
ncbi:putative benzoate 4-monooxygenase cytochrome P450 [Paraphaeosphaeria sporulosa]|uniref:Putative benzoate 4-monooxygenase cytochrome P450 n=1 Tax=Paraphaeosphaeria sporulosa TaxID=1460663 RepID=A0A177CJ47_9PLEO|nr:putative benzoate 4-monooxygenase cytochrome P450 [Paraphaeosphaeria sporulosa]OAG07002.1 putative benzoate 4-monooxygenase cytochrome P450 [Paraphaeosphaeria sporulosa]